MKILRPPFNVNWLSIARFSLPGNVMFVKSKFLKKLLQFPFSFVIEQNKPEWLTCTMKSGHNVMFCTVVVVHFSSHLGV